MSLGESVTVSQFFPSGDLSAPRVSLRPPALVTLTHDVVKVHGTGNAVLQMAVAGTMT